MLRHYQRQSLSHLLERDYEDAVAVLDRIPKEVLAEYMHKPDRRRINAYDR